AGRGGAAPEGGLVMTGQEIVTLVQLVPPAIWRGFQFVLQALADGVLQLGTLIGVLTLYLILRQLEDLKTVLYQIRNDARRRQDEEIDPEWERPRVQTWGEWWHQKGKPYAGLAVLVAIGLAWVGFTGGKPR